LLPKNLGQTIACSRTALTSKATKWKWEPQQQKAFTMAKQIIANEAMPTHPDSHKPFQTQTDASHCQLGAVVSQEGKPIAFCNHQLNPGQTRHTSAERKPLGMAKTLKEHQNMLLG